MQIWNITKRAHIRSQNCLVALKMMGRDWLSRRHLSARARGSPFVSVRIAGIVGALVAVLGSGMLDGRLVDVLFLNLPIAEELWLVEDAGALLVLLLEAAGPRDRHSVA